MAMGKAALVFCPTRNFAEECHRTARRRVEQLRADGLADLNMDAIRVFRGGLSADDRHEIQDGLVTARCVSRSPRTRLNSA